MNLLLLNKPYNVLCQFTDTDGRQTLADFIAEPDFYAAGRLDRDSEGLLVLTNDGKLQQRISDPKYKMPKTYFAQVEGEVTSHALETFAKGVNLKDGLTLPALAEQIQEPLWLWPRNPPIRKRQSIPTSWISLTITEGKNRQIRRMTAAAGHPTLRLIRTRVGPWALSAELLQPQSVPTNTAPPTDLLTPGNWRGLSIKKQELRHT